MVTVNLNFDGYYSDAQFPLDKFAKSGVYAVYVAVENPETINIRRLIYVGEAEDVSDRIVKHERKEDWEKKLKNGESLWYSIALVNAYDRKRAEAAVINHHSDIIKEFNIEYIEHFPFPDTEIIITGNRNKFLDTKFTVQEH